jgi:hypothetical protein
MSQGSMIQEQLRKAQLEAERLREQLKKQKAAARKEGFKPSFPGQHRGY